MANDEVEALDRFRDRVGSLERLVERLDERMLGKLGKDDATMLMEYASEGDGKLRDDFLGRLSDFRIEVREAFKHNERETASAIYRAVTESEGRLTAAITALTATISASSPQQGERRGWHPVVTYGGGGVSVASLVALLMYFASGGRFGMPG